MKLQTRLMLSLSGVTAVVLGPSLLALHLMVTRDEVTDFDRALLVQANASAHQVLSPGAGRSLAEGRVQVPESLVSTARYLVIYDAQGRPTAGSRNFDDKLPSLEELGIAADEQVSWEGTPVDLQVGERALRGVVIQAGNKGERLLLAASRDSITEDVRFLNRSLSALFAGAMLVTAALAGWLGRVLARDVEAIASVARAVTQGSLEARVGAAAVGSVETRALAADLDEMIARLSALVEGQQTFIAHAAHELRSPLASVRGELQLALRRPRTTEEYRRALQSVSDDVEALVLLAEDLLVLARIQARGTSIEAAEPVAPGELVADTLRMLRGLAQARGIGFEVVAPHFASQAVKIRGSRSELARVLRNLVDNAIRHGPEDSCIRIEQTLVEGQLEISVSDSGAGVPDADRDQLFTPFFRGERSRSSEQIGSGLGLAIAQSIARAHGGDVRLDLGIDAGARFVFRIPAAA